MGGLLLAFAAALGCGATARAAPPTLRDRLFGGPSDERAFVTPPVGRFQPDDGDPFVLDRSAGREVFMKFESSPEIWALEPTPGPRGDVIYKDDMGEPVLRATRLGGLTLFTPERPGGTAAAFAGQASLLRPPPIGGPGALLQSFAQASERAARAVHHSVTFETQDVPIAAAPLVADTAAVTAEAFVEVAGRGERERTLAGRFSKVEIGVGAAPEAHAVGETMRIAIDPDRGFAGRPSSHRIADAIGRR